MTVVLLAVGPPGILPIYCPRPGYIDLTDLLRFVDPIAVIASSIYAVERLIRRRASLWQFSLKELLIAVTTICLAISVVATQYRESQRLDEITKHGTCVYFVYPPLVGTPWFLRLPLLFGLVCLAYTFVEGALWGVRKAIWWLTSNWEHPDDGEAEGR